MTTDGPKNETQMQEPFLICVALRLPLRCWLCFQIPRPQIEPQMDEDETQIKSPFSYTRVCSAPFALWFQIPRPRLNHRWTQDEHRSRAFLPVV